MTRKCINCGLPIPKKTHWVRFEKPVSYQPATTKVLMGRTYPEFAERQAKPEGHRDVDSHGNSTVYTDHPPKTKAECQRYVNGHVLAVKRHWQHPEAIHEFSHWDGESYQDRFFHSGRCAQQFAYKVADRGVRL